MSVGQMSLDSISEDINKPQKCKWAMRPRCFRCGVWLCKEIKDETGIIQSTNERVCAGCGQVNRLD